MFISDSHHDRAWLERLRRHLRPAERLGAYRVWDDTQIEAGELWRGSLRSAMATASVAVLLVSPQSLASQFITTVEIKTLLANPLGPPRVVWVHLGRIEYEPTALAGVQGGHDVARPLDELSPAEQNAAFVQIARAIRRNVQPARSP